MTGFFFLTVTPPQVHSQLLQRVITKVQHLLETAYVPASFGTYYIDNVKQGMLGAQFINKTSNTIKTTTPEALYQVSADASLP